MKKKKETQILQNQKDGMSNIIVILHLLFGTLPIILVVFLVNEFFKGNVTIRMIAIVAVLMFVFALLKGFFYGASIWRAHKSAYEALTKLRIKIVAHLQKLPLGFFQERKVGDLTNIIHHDVEQIELYLAHGRPEILSATLLPFVLWILVLFLDWRLGLALVSLLPVAVLLQKVFNRMWRESFKHFSDSTKQMSEDLLEYVATIPVIKAFSHEETRTGKVLQGMRDYIHWVKNSMISIAVPMSIISMLLEGGVIVMIITGMVLIGNGDLSVSSFILALILGGIFASCFVKLSTFQHIGIVYNQSVQRVHSIINVPPKENTDIKINPSGDDVSFEDVSFTYPNKTEKALLDVNLEFPKGSHTAVVGESGSGKTTLASLMMAFWQPQSGIIFIGNEPVNNLSEKNIAELFSMVQQDVFLFNISIEDNIRIGKPTATRAEVESAARRARIHDFIMSLPNGYETLAGEAGVKFSGGEKQRISIARMILKDSPIIILDEATAALDGENERLIHEALDDLQSDKTVITIAHRLNTIREMDNIVVMDKGKVIATGNHDELMQQCDMYKEMIEKQTIVNQWQLN